MKSRQTDRPTNGPANHSTGQQINQQNNHLTDEGEVRLSIWQNISNLAFIQYLHLNIDHWAGQLRESNHNLWAGQPSATEATTDLRVVGGGLVSGEGALILMVGDNRAAAPPPPLYDKIGIMYHLKCLHMTHGKRVLETWHGRSIFRFASGDKDNHAFALIVWERK